MNQKHYKSIKEVSKLLNIKEHVIRHWDSIDPKTKKIRIPGLSTRTEGGIRYFNRDNIKKLEELKNVLFDNGKHIYSLDLANKLIKSNKNKKYNINNDFKQSISKNSNVRDISKLENIAKKLKKLAES